MLLTPALASITDCFMKGARQGCTEAEHLKIIWAYNLRSNSAVTLQHMRCRPTTHYPAAPYATRSSVLAQDVHLTSCPRTIGTAMNGLPAPRKNHVDWKLSRERPLYQSQLRTNRTWCPCNECSRRKANAQSNQPSKAEGHHSAKN